MISRKTFPKASLLAREKMLVFLKEVEQKFGADPRKTILGGFSQGAMLSCDAVLHTDRPYAGLDPALRNLLAAAGVGPAHAEAQRACRSFKATACRTRFCPMSERSDFATH